MLLLIAGCRSKPDHNWLLYARNDWLWSAEKDQGTKNSLDIFRRIKAACVSLLYVIDLVYISKKYFTISSSIPKFAYIIKFFPNYKLNLINFFLRVSSIKFEIMGSDFRNNIIKWDICQPFMITSQTIFVMS